MSVLLTRDRRSSAPVNSSTVGSGGEWWGVKGVVWCGGSGGGDGGVLWGVGGVVRCGSDRVW